MPSVFGRRHRFLVNGGVRSLGLPGCDLVDKSRLGQTGRAEGLEKVSVHKDGEATGVRA